MAFNRGPGGSQSGSSEIEDTPVTIAQGGTSATTAVQARANLGIGTMGTQPSNSVSITGGSITGITPLPVSSGGTGASGQAEARTNLGIASAATQATEYFATAAQGALADSAVQPGDLATVATSGDYDDLSNKPTIPANLDDLGDVVITTPSNTQVLSYNGTNWVNANASFGSGDVVGPVSAVDSGVALFDGTTGKLIKDGGVLGTAAFTSTGDYATAAQGALADTATQPGDLATVATSGDYTDLINKPTLGTAAATDSTDYATAAQGALADTALQSFTETDPVVGAITGIVKADGAGNISAAVSGTDYATGAQGSLADSAVQPGDNISTLTNDSGFTTNTGTVTSVDATVPTGLAVSGNPITTSGTLAVTYATGYAIPTTAKQSNWDTAYGWGDHSSEGYLTTAVTSATAGTGISVSSSTGAVTFNNTAPDQTVALTAGTGISTSGTYPNFTITNSAPDQTVSLTGSGATSISGTYPNFTISSTDTNTTYTAGTGLSLAGTTFSNSDRGSSQNIFKNIAVSGQSTIVADSNNDTVTVVAGTGVALTTNATTDTLTITNSAPDQTVAISSGTGISVSGTYPNFTVAATNNGTVTSVGLSAPTGFSVTGSPVSTTGTLALSFATGYSLPTTASQTNWNTAYGWGDHAAAGYLDAADIGVTVQGYDVDTAKYDATTANFTGTLQNGGSNVLVDTDIGSTVQAYDATIVVDADIGVTVQGYDADTAKYDDTTANFTGTLQNGGSNVLVDTDIGSTVQAYDSNLTSFVNTFTLPTTDGSSGQILTTNGTGTLSFTSPGGSGTVTSVGMTVPTGLTVSGSPITSSGTLAVTYSAGYAIPTTTKQSNWDTAYSWGNHALAGYAADSAVVKLTGNQTIAGTKTFSSTISGSITGNAGTVTNGVYTTGNQTIGGTKTFSSTISGSITGNAGTVTNGVVTTGSYANPSWITSLSETKVLPSQTSQSGKYLTTNGTSTSWATVDALPSQTGNSGKYLTTDGTTASWATVSGGQYLGTAATKAIMYNAQSIAENITISGSYNALSAGPITIDSTYTVTVSSGAVWTIV